MKHHIYFYHFYHFYHLNLKWNKILIYCIHSSNITFVWFTWYFDKLKKWRDKEISNIKKDQFWLDSVMIMNSWPNLFAMVCTRDFFSLLLNYTVWHRFGSFEWNWCWDSFKFSCFEFIHSVVTIKRMKLCTSSAFSFHENHIILRKIRCTVWLYQLIRSFFPMDIILDIYLFVLSTFH